MRAGAAKGAGPCLRLEPGGGPGSRGTVGSNGRARGALEGPHPGGRGRRTGAGACGAALAGRVSDTPSRDALRLGPDAGFRAVEEAPDIGLVLKDDEGRDDQNEEEASL